MNQTVLRRGRSGCRVSLASPSGAPAAGRPRSWRQPACAWTPPPGGRLRHELAAPHPPGFAIARANGLAASRMRSAPCLALLGTTRLLPRTSAARSAHEHRVSPAIPIPRLGIGDALRGSLTLAAFGRRLTDGAHSRPGAPGDPTPEPRRARPVSPGQPEPTVNRAAARGRSGQADGCGAAPPCAKLTVRQNSGAAIVASNASTLCAPSQTRPHIGLTLLRDFWYVIAPSARVFGPV
jgi:hypothetical protein